MALTLNFEHGLSSSHLQVILGASQAKGQDVLCVPRHGLNGLIRSISEKQESAEPFYILDLGVVIRLMERWNLLLPNVQPFYAVKCNTEPALIVALATLGANFDCASQAEIEAVLGLGVSPDRIVYANPCKGESHIKFAAGVGVNLTTFDSMEEVNKIKKWHPKCALLLRIQVPNDESSWRPLGTKFGAMPEEVMPLLQHANKAGLEVVGVSFHVGSKASEADVYRGAIAMARAAFDAAAKLKMPPMHVLNIGGGFKVNPLFDEITATINEGIQEYFSSEPSLLVIAEPGRFFVETAFTMVTNVIGKRVRSEQREYWIDDGIYGSFNLPAYDRSSMMMKPLLINADHAGPLISSTVFGPTCDSLDTVVSDCKLPELQVKDLLVFYNMGAYTTSAGTKFNGFNTSAFSTSLAYSVPN